MPLNMNRVMKEVIGLQALGTNNNPSQVIFLLDKSPADTPGSNIILGRILPQLSNFNQAQFQIEISLSDAYPFQPPTIRFITLIYHPNVDENGKICIESLNSLANYRPVTSLAEIVKDLVHLINCPNLEHALCPDIAAEYANNRPLFDRKATEMIINTVHQNRQLRY